MNNIAGSGGRWIDVAPARFPGWIASFAARHGAGAPDAALSVTLAGDDVIFAAPDGAVAECRPPFPPFPPLPAFPSISPGGPAGDPGASDVATAAAVAELIAAHALRPRTVGVLLVRLGGYAAGVFTGSPPGLADAKTGSRPVHGRSAAGGWSQHRFARRREKQASEALQAAADAAAAVFGRWGVSRGRSDQMITARGGDADSTGRPALDAVVLGGDKRTAAGLAADPRLAPYLALATDRFLTVPDPKRAVLLEAPKLFLAVKIKITEPAA
ncbi:MAG TPA: acVLRF1 family peptidyl-tRNA hydrolase [Trebonia sp.]|nr:acVLRF1 family peptidyl-tRNA hydrolase [Trebonia sp.]